MLNFILYKLRLIGLEAAAALMKMSKHNVIYSIK